MNAKSKVLIISHNSFSKVHNNGKTLESFFSGFEKKNIAQLYFSQNENPDFDYCENYYQVTDRNIVDKFIKCSSQCGGVVLKTEDRHLSGNDILFRVLKRKSDYLTFFRDLLWKTKVWKTKELRQWYQGFSPDAIFYVGGSSGFSHFIARFISKEIEKPLIAYFTDDYLIFPRSRTLLEKIQKWRMRRFYKKTVEQSVLLFAIGDMMAKEYTRYFQKFFLPIMNSVPVIPYVAYQPNEKIVISYFGGLHLNRWKMLVRLATVAVDIDFDVYTIEKPTEDVMEEFQMVGIRYRGGVQGEELQNAMLKSDILLHVESDDDYNKSLTKLSVSTKIPEYLMTGRLILGFGPIEVASMRILSDNNVGIVISSSVTNDELKILLNDVIHSPELRYKVGFNGYVFATDRFNNSEIARDFSRKIESVTNNII